VKMGIGVLRYNGWVRWARQKRSKRAENIRKVMRNVRKYSKNDVKRLKIFENIRIFCRLPAHLIDFAPLTTGAFFDKVAKAQRDKGTEAQRGELG